ncbi:MAG: hypothetical protein ACOYLK_09775 [Sphingomonas sp.]
MANWTISNGTVSTTVDASMNPAFVIKIGGKTYVTVLVTELTGSATAVPRQFYENQFAAMKLATASGEVYAINTAGERTQGNVNVVNVDRPPN